MPYVASEVTTGGSTLYIEISEVSPPVESGPTTAGGSPGALLGKLENVGAAAGEACSKLFEQLEAALGKVKPAEVTIEFGITLGGEAGIPFVTKGTAEASFSISATWTAGPAPAAVSP